MLAHVHVCMHFCSCACVDGVCCVIGGQLISVFSDGATASTSSSAANGLLTAASTGLLTAASTAAAIDRRSAALGASADNATPEREAQQRGDNLDLSTDTATPHVTGVLDLSAGATGEFALSPQSI